MTPSVPESMQHDHNDTKDRIAEDISKLTVAPLEVAPLANDIVASDISNLNWEHHKRTKLEDSSRINLISCETSERPVIAQTFHTGDNSVAFYLGFIEML